ncbi:MAG: C69 family dipeptidase [Prevotellaceae bacterium]|jgi:dipeptidase|nr:C69 family dipeptidase [Prevotellaceae bacterium]
MDRKILLALVMFLLSSNYLLPCTNFLVGKKASADGSTFITYAADSYFLFGSLHYSQAATYPEGAMREIYEWDSGKYLGQIRQAAQTYSVIGNMNEHQVCIGETTFGGLHELVDTTGIIDYGSLMYIALERAKTAREAIKIMTGLVAEYGYYSEGESFSIADPNEVWILEMVGKGAGSKGAVWVAQRIPDDCVSAHANQARITQIQFSDKENCIYSPDVVEFARKKGLFKGKDSEFSFSDTYNPLDDVSLRVCEARVWTFFKDINPDMYRYISYVKGETKERMPLWVKPVIKLSAQNMKDFMRDQYEGTEFDMTEGYGAGPFHSKLRHSPLTYFVDSVEYLHDRPVATQQTAFSFVGQMRGWLPDYVGGILWFGVDDAASSCYVPVYCSVNKAPWCFSHSNGSLLEYSSSSAFWVFNQVANFAYGKYSFIQPEIKNLQQQWDNYFNESALQTDKLAINMSEQDAKQMLTENMIKQAEDLTNAWRKLGEYILVKYLDGNIKAEENGTFIQNEAKIPPRIIRPGYPVEFSRQMVKEKPHLRVKSKEEMEKRK